MSVVELAAPARTCGCCGRAIRKGHAKVADKLYCHTCYMRELDSEPCSKCGHSTRLQTAQGIPLCRSCRSVGRVCLRCGKDVRQAGLTLPEGVACASCARYFKEPRPCAACGQLSLRLSRDFKHGFMEPVCSRCRSKGFITCACCGKHRRPAAVNADGKAVCKRCDEAAGQPFVCPKCHKTGRRHSATRCEDCYWADTAAARTRQAAALLTQTWTRDVFLEFCEELRGRIPPIKAALRVDRYFLFFAKLDCMAADRHELTGEKLTAVFGAEGLRRHSVPYGYLVRVGIVTPPADEDVQAVTQAQAQQRLLERARGKWFEALLGRFHAHLITVRARYVSRGWTGNRARFLPRTITLALQAAAKFLVNMEGTDVTTPQGLQQAHLDRFLATHTGHRNSLRAFVRYLNRREKLFRPIKVPNTERAFSADLLLRRAKYEELTNAWLGADDDHLKESLVCILMLLYAQPVKRTVRLRLSQIGHGRDGVYRIVFGAVEIALDARVGAMMDRYLASRRAIATMDDPWRNDYLFTGRRVGSHLTPAAVTYYLGKYGVRAEQLFASAIYRAYLAGLRHPKMLVRAFGISDVTAVHYIELLDPRLRDEVERQIAHA
jgi:hypothetical protein